MYNIKDRIKELRKEKGLTQEGLAKMLGLSAKSNIANYENGANAPSDEVKLKMCEIFNCSMDYLIGKSTYRNYEDYQNAQEFVLKNISTLNKEEVQEITTLLNYINQNNIKDVENFINDKLSDSESPNKETLKKIISHLYHKFHDKNIPSLQNTFVLNKYSSIKDLEDAEKLISINKKEDNCKLFNIPIVGKIAAGQPILAEEYLEGYLPVDPNIYGMTTPDDYFYLKVAGESMNLKVHNGDYALIHKQDYADDGDIVVAIVNGDDEATLKKYKRINEDTIALEPMSTLPMDPIYVNLKDTNFKIIGKAIGQFGKF